MEIAAIIILLIISAICSATETAFSSCNRIRLKKLADDGNKSAKNALYICEHFDKALTAILIGNNVVNILSSALATVLFTKHLGKGSVGAATLVMTVLVLIFGEILPKSLAKENSESFSILMARYKGELPALVDGARTLSKLRDGDQVLISEGCTHHRQCGDIGSVKLPAWIESFSGAKPEYEFTSGGGFTSEPEEYKVIVHCGGCMLNEKEMKHRIETAEAAGVPIVNYGIAIAHMHGILKRSLEPFEQEI